jgi:hypothetical protein
MAKMDLRDMGESSVSGLMHRFVESSPWARNGFGNAISSVYDETYDRSRALITRAVFRGSL